LKGVDSLNTVRIYRFLYAVSVILAIGFCVRLGMDWYSYNTTLNSAPFWLFAAVGAVEFLLPAAILLIVAQIIKKKGK